MEGVRRRYARPRDPQNFVGPIDMKIGTWIHLGCRFAPQVYTFSVVKILTPFGNQYLTYQIAGFSYYDIVANRYWFY